MFIDYYNQIQEKFNTLDSPITRDINDREEKEKFINFNKK